MTIQQKKMRTKKKSSTTKRYVIRKFIEGASINDVLKKDRNHKPDEVYLSNTQPDEQSAEKIGF